MTGPERMTVVILSYSAPGAKGQECSKTAQRCAFFPPCVALCCPVHAELTEFSYRK